MADQIIKAESKHYKAWLEKEESTLVDALLILNETHPNESKRLPKIVVLNHLVSKEVPNGTKLTFPYHSVFLSKIKEVISLILSNKIKVLKKPGSFCCFDSPYYFNETFQNRFIEDSKVLLETLVKPRDFVAQLLEYKNILPEELQHLIKPDKQVQAAIQSSKLSTSESNEPTPQTKPLDRRRENSYQIIIGAFMEWHYKNYDPDAPKNMDTSKVLDLLDNIGSDLSRATPKKS